MKHLLFVYGTLMKGYRNHRVIQNADFLGTATTLENFTMFDNCVFPAVVHTPSYVIEGEVYAIDKATFERADHLEGYNRSNPSDSHYQRRQVIVRMHVDDAPVTVWIYYQDTKNPKGMRRMQHGDYKRIAVPDENLV